jgi:hypothetical protein
MPEPPRVADSFLIPSKVKSEDERSKQHVDCGTSNDSLGAHSGFCLLASGNAQWLNYPTAGIPRFADGKPNLTAPAPKTADGKPDLSGLWEPSAVRAGVAGAIGGGPPPEFLNIDANRKDPLPYRPWTLQLVKARQAENGKEDPHAHCLPLSIVRMHSHPYPRKMFQLPGVLVILYKMGVNYRQIFTDGRPLPADPNPSFNGYSSGKWEGDTLVVETVGFRDDLWVDHAGDPLTEAAEVTERFRRPDYGHLEIEVTVDDPKAYTKPWTVQLGQSIVLNTDLLEYFCENERDIPHLVGR